VERDRYLSLAAGGTVAGATTFSAGIIASSASIGSAVANTPLSVQTADGTFHEVFKNTAGASKFGFLLSGGTDFTIYNFAIGSVISIAAATSISTFSAGIVGTTATFSGAVTGATLTGTLQTAAQPNVTSLGVIANLSTSGTAAISNSSQTTAACFGVFVNTGGRNYWGVESSVGGTMFSGSLPYAIVFGTDSAKSVQFATSNLIRATIDAGGAFLVGTTLTTGAAAGELVLAHTKAIRSVNSVATATVSLIRHDAIGGAADVTVFGNTSRVNAFDGVASVTSAGAGDVVLPNAKALRWANGAGNDTLNALQIGSDNVLVIGSTLKIVIGSTVTSTGVNAGDLALANTKDLRAASFLNNTTVSLIRLSAANLVEIDRNGQGASFGGGAVFAGAVSGVSTLAMGGALSGVTTLAMAGALSGATTIGASSSVDVGVGHIKAGTTTAVTSVGATTIYTAVNAQGFAIVHGSSAGKIFCDLITWDTSIPAVALLAGNILAGVPGARTYSMSGSNIQLQMSATGNSVKVVPIELN
jgi:hypothetical protein